MYEHLRHYQYFSIPSYLINKCLDPTLKTTLSVSDLPKEEGCYLLVWNGIYVIYVGESGNLRKRWASHNLEKIIGDFVYKDGTLAGFCLEYYLTEGGNRKKIQDFLIYYYWPILCGNWGNRNYIDSIITNSPDLYGRALNIAFRCEKYYKDCFKRYEWQDRCAKFYHNYHRFFGSFESCHEQISQISKIKKCEDISPFFPNFYQPEYSIIYAKFKSLKD